MKPKKNPGNRGRKFAFALLWTCAALVAGAAESNAVALDLQVDEVRYVDSNVLAFPLDWESGLVPAGVTKATLRVKGAHVDVSNTVSKPAASISCTLFDEPPVPFRSDSLKATLVFASDDGALAVTNTATYELRAGSFARGRVLTVAESSNRWRHYQPPVDIPYDTRWFPSLLGGHLTWLSASNLVTGVNTQKTGMAPLNGDGGPRGFVPMEKEVYPVGAYYLKIYSGSTLVSDVWLDGVVGSMVIVR